MLFLARNYELIKDREKTYLTAAVDSGGTSLTVRAVDSNAWADNDWVILGEIGSKTAEILQINGAVLDGTTLIIDNAGAGGCRYSHATDEPVYRIDYNQIEFSRASTITGSKSVLSTAELQVDDLYTRYEDQTNSTGFGFVRFKNSATSSFSAFSDGIAYTGYTAKSLGKIIKGVRRLLGEYDYRKIDDADITEEANQKQRDIAHERLWPFYETIYSDSRVAYQRDYTINAKISVGKVHTVTVESEPIAKTDAARFDQLFWDVSVTGEPTHCSIWNNKLRFYPVPDAAATTTTLDGALSASATSITVASTSGFSPSGRIIIDSEVISYTNLTSTQFRGCTRAEEGTTAATHTTTTTVTERDIVYTGNEEPTDLADIGDETNIPDPECIVYGIAMELAIGKLQDQVMHDRFKIKYDQSIERLRDKFGRKMTSVFHRIKDRSEVISDTGRFRNPNDYPTLS